MSNVPAHQMNKIILNFYEIGSYVDFLALEMKEKNFDIELILSHSLYCLRDYDSYPDSFEDVLAVFKDRVSDEDDRQILEQIVRACYHGLRRHLISVGAYNENRQLSHTGLVYQPSDHLLWLTKPEHVPASIT